jgi:hypothetical protein
MQGAYEEGGEAVDIMWFRKYCLRNLRLTYQSTDSARWQHLEAKYYASCRLSALVSSWTSGNGTGSSPVRAGLLTTVPFTARAPWCLNFSVRPCQILSLSITTSHGHLLLRHCGQVSQVSLGLDHLLFSSTQSISVSNNRSALKMTSLYSSSRIGDPQNVFTEASLSHWRS